MMEPSVDELMPKGWSVLQSGDQVRAIKLATGKSFFAAGPGAYESVRDRARAHDKLPPLNGDANESR